MKKTEKTVSESRNSRKPLIILAIIILLQVLVVTYYVAFEKEGFHSDEPWGIGFANSFDGPYVYDREEDPVHYVKNDNWVDGSMYKNYLTVREDQRFRYDKVIENVSHDMHPHLYFLLLHTVSSFFPGVFSKYILFSVNVIAMIMGQIFFYKLCKKLTDSEYLALLFTAAWGFTSGFINLNMYLRMYSLLTAFSIMMLYYHVLLFKDEGSRKKNLILLGITVFLGCMTHYYFYVLGCVTAACFCFYYLFKKDWKKLFPYAFTLAGSAVLTLILFPDVFTLVFGASEFNESRLATKMPFFNGFRTCIALILNSICGLFITSYSTGIYAYFVAAFVIIAAVAIPLYFLFRKEVWLKKFVSCIKEKLSYFFKHFDFILFFIFVGIISICVLVSLNVNINAMANMTDRYLFLIMPWAMVGILLLFIHIFKHIKVLEPHISKILTVLCCAAVLGSNMLCEKKYIIKANKAGDTDMETLFDKDSTVILLPDSYWMTTTVSPKLINCGKVFASSVYSYRNFIDRIKEAEITDKFYISVDITALADNILFSNEFSKDNDSMSMENITYIFEKSEDDMNNADKTIEDSDEPIYDPVHFTEADLINDFEKNIFPGYKLQLCCSESIFGRRFRTYQLVPEDEYVEVVLDDDYIITDDFETIIDNDK